MRTVEEFEARMLNYPGADWVYDPAVGCLAWQFGTGGNLEALDIQAAEPGRGQGVELYRRMVAKVEAGGRLPYWSIFAFRRSANHRARRFYEKLGWRQRDLGESVYAEGGTTVMWQPWHELKEALERLNR